jgi:sterol desaturase/sphingolipid hydroxylase (fatty acid hydroxylase superfamily)
MSLLTIEHSPLAYRFDFLLHGAAVVGMGGALLHGGPVAQWRALLLLTLLGLLSWSLLEYLLHRFVLHGVAPFCHWHQQHHQRPTALIGSPTLLSISLIAGLVFLPAWWLQGVWVATAFTLGLSLGYLVYATVHHATHHGRTGPGWLRLRKRWHAKHHRLGDVHFGVTSSFWDHLLGSAAKPMQDARPRRVGPA